MDSPGIDMTYCTLTNFKLIRYLILGGAQPDSIFDLGNLRFV